jgi:hypothetical protein
MEYNETRTSTNSKVRREKATEQPKGVQNGQPGRGDKKLEGPNRPST